MASGVSALRTTGGSRLYLQSLEFGEQEGRRTSEVAETCFGVGALISRRPAHGLACPAEASRESAWSR